MLFTVPDLKRVGCEPRLYESVAPPRPVLAEPVSKPDASFGGEPPGTERDTFVRLRCPRDLREDVGLRDHRLTTTTSLIRRPDRRSVDAPGRRRRGPRA